MGNEQRAASSRAAAGSRQWVAGSSRQQQGEGEGEVKAEDEGEAHGNDNDDKMVTMVMAGLA